MSDDAWIADFKAENRGVTVESRSDGGLDARATGANIRIDLSRVPDGGHLHLQHTASGANRLTIVNARPTHRVTCTFGAQITVADGRIGELLVAFPRAGDRTSGSLTGAVELVRLESGAVTFDDLNTDQLVLAGGRIEGTVPPGVKVRADGTAALPGDLPSLRIDADVTLLLPPSRTTVARLTVTRRCTVRLVSEPRREGHLRVSVLDGGPARFELEGESVLELETCEAEELAVEGRGRVIVRANGTVKALDLPTGRVPLRIGAGAAVRSLAGQVRILGCRHATLLASPGSGFDFEGTVNDRRQREHLPKEIEHATLRGIRVEDSPKGRQWLQDLRLAAVVDPDVEHLRIRRRRHRYEVWHAGRARIRPDDPEVGDAAFFAQELAGLTAEKSTSGSIRTKAAWAAYRGRHLTARSWWERRALDLFKLVGYGQRPGPAIATWVLLATLLAVPMLFLNGNDTTTDGAWSGWLVEAIRLLLGPLVVVRLGTDSGLDTTELAGLVGVLIQAVVAVPFVFAVVATARFLRADWPWVGGRTT